MDIHLPLRMSAEDWSTTGGGAFINPSATLVDESRLILAARLHRRSYRKSTFENGTLLEEIWFSQIFLGSLSFDSEDWQALNASGAIPGGQINMRPWDGLRMVDSKPWTYPNMCYRERWLPENKTMLRFVVTGPEDPKVFPLTTAGSCSNSRTDCWSLREPTDWCGKSPSHCETQCNSRWCSHQEVQLAFNSSSPKEGKSCDRRDVSQMFLASGVNVRHPEHVIQGRHLRCGRLFLDSPRGPRVGRHRQLRAAVAQYLPKVGRDAVAAVGDGYSRFSTGRLCERAQRDSSFATATLLGTLPCCGSKGASLCALRVSLLAEAALPDPAGLQGIATGDASSHARMWRPVETTWQKGTGLCFCLRPGST